MPKKHWSETAGWELAEVLSDVLVIEQVNVLLSFRFAVSVLCGGQRLYFTVCLGLHFAVGVLEGAKVFVSVA